MGRAWRQEGEQASERIREVRGGAGGGGPRQTLIRIIEGERRKARG